jgi:flagellar hook-length control protein FliK
MDPVSNAPAPAATALEAATPRPPAEKSATGAKPFEQALRQELAKPESAKTGKPGKPPQPKADTQKAAAAAPLPAGQAVTPEWAALLESAGLVEEPDTDLAAGTGSAQIAADPESAPVEALIGDPAAIPVVPLLVVPAQPAAPTPAPGLGLAQGNRVAVDARLRADALEARVAHAADAAAPELATADAAPESLVTAFGGQGARAVETPASALHSPALDGLASGTFAPRWAPPALAETAAAQAPATARIDTPLGNTGWGAAFQQKIVWLVDRQQQNAELHVNPPHLGPIEITLNLGEEATHIAFTSPHAAVREAIEASLAELKTALAEKGLTLGQATVGSDSQAAREQLRGEARAGSAGGRNGIADTPTEASPPPRVVARGLVDIFA